MFDNEVVAAVGGGDCAGPQDGLIAFRTKVNRHDMVAVEAEHGHHGGLACGFEVLHHHAAGEGLVAGVNDGSVAVLAFPFASERFELFQGRIGVPADFAGGVGLACYGGSGEKRSEERLCWETTTHGASCG